MAGPFGWIRDSKDDRDLVVPVSVPAVPYPVASDMLDVAPECYHQSLGDCTGNAGAGLLQIKLHLEGHADCLEPSRLFLYYFARALHGNEKKDTGAELRDIAKVAAKTGYCYSDLWPYLPKQFTKRPGADAVNFAGGHKITQYARVAQSEDGLKSQVLAKNPVMFGFDCFKSVLNMKPDGIMQMPRVGEKPQGGHAVVVIGYKDGVYANGECGYLIRNSWGKHWGLSGNFYMPASFILDNKYASDFWTFTDVPALS